MSRRIAVNLLVSVLALATLAVAKTPRPLADVSVSMPDGKKLRIQQYKGKVMVVALLATNCDECAGVLELLSRAQKANGPRGFQAVGVAVNIDAPQEIKGWVDRNHPTFPTGFLDHDGLIKIGDIQATDKPYVPIMLFVDKKGIVRNQYFGDDQLMKQLPTIVNGLVDKLLKEQ